MYVMWEHKKVQLRKVCDRKKIRVNFDVAINGVDLQCAGRDYAAIS